MAYKLSKADEAKLTALITDAEQLKTTIENEVVDANQAIADIVEHLNGFVSAYNEKAQEVKAFIEEKAENWRSEFDDRSEVGQQNERGQAIDEFVQQWESAEVEELEEVKVDDIELEVPDLPSLETLPSELEV